MSKTFAVLLIAMSAVAARADEPAPPPASPPTFTKAEVEAAYALGRADQARAQIAVTPDALSMARKLQPPPADKK